jgi:hypothetical protein
VLHEQVSGKHLSGGQLFNEQVSVNLRNQSIGKELMKNQSAEFYFEM